ncbi:MAG: four helix bundle protein, partial [Gammaproteobacteria bacterium]
RARAPPGTTIDERCHGRRRDDQGDREVAMDALQGLAAWNRACQLTVETYKALASCADSNFRDHVTRSSLAVPTRIADGYERRSRPQFAENLRAARGSCAEMRTQLYIAADVGLLEAGTAHRLIAEALQVSKMLQTLIARCEHQGAPRE